MMSDTDTIAQLESTRDEAYRIYQQETKKVTIVNGFHAEEAWTKYCESLKHLAQAKKELSK